MSPASEERTLAAKAGLLDLLLEATNDGVLDWDLITNQATYNPRWQSLLGFENGELTQFDGGPNLWRDMIHPDDLPGTLALLRDHLEQGWPFTTTARMVHLHGGYRHILCRGAARRDAHDKPIRMVMMFTDISDRIRAEEQQRALVSALPDTLIRVRRDGIILGLKQGSDKDDSPFAALVEGKTLAACLGAEALRERIEAALAVACDGRGGPASVQTFEVTTTLRPGSVRHHELRVISCGEDEAVCVARDATEQRALEQRLLQAQKLQAIGHLAAGVAHEINTPMQFIGDNLHFMDGAVKDMLGFVRVLKDLIAEGAREALGPAALERAARAESESDFEYAQGALPVVLESSLSGVERVTKIVRAMKTFAHPGGQALAPVDLKQLIESTVTVATNEWKYVADVELALDPDLPLVACIASELSQALLNLIVNAAHAIGDVVQGTGDKGRIALATQLTPEYAEIRVEDSGSGIPEAVRSKVFDPFFTTKEVGRGTGQGLALAHACVVERHHGTIHFETEVGKGTTFFIRLPLGERAAAFESEEPA